MFDILSDIVDGTVDGVDSTKKFVKGVTPDAGTIRGLLGLGMTIYEISDVTGIAVSVLEGILPVDYAQSASSGVVPNLTDLLFLRLTNFP